MNELRNRYTTVVKDVEKLTLSLSMLNGEIESLKREIGVLRTAPSAKSA